MSAAAALDAAAGAALRTIDGLGVFDGAPVQAAVPYALVEAGPETDWGHKSGQGRELRLAVTIRDAGESGGERAVRLRRLMEGAESALAGIGPALDGWRIVTLRFIRGRVVKDAKKGTWAGVIEHRARLLKE